MIVLFHAPNNEFFRSLPTGHLERLRPNLGGGIHYNDAGAQAMTARVHGYIGATT